MRNFDFSPLYRSTIGFDHLSSLLDAVNRNDASQPSYPPYNIELIDQDKYQITMAIAGFVENELELQSEKQTLTVKGKKKAAKREETFCIRVSPRVILSAAFNLPTMLKSWAPHLQTACCTSISCG